MAISDSIKEIRYVSNRSKFWRYKRHYPKLKILLSIAFGASLSFSYAPYSYWYLLLPGLLWLFYCLEYNNKGQALTNGFIFSLSFWVSGIYWVYHSIYFYGNSGPIFSPLLVGLLCLFITSIFVLLLWLYKKLTANAGLFDYIKQPSMNKIIAFGGVWVAFESLLNLLTFPWLGLGNVLIDAPKPIDQWLAIIGVSGSSFVLASLAAALYFTLRMVWQLFISLINPTILGSTKLSDYAFAPSYILLIILATVALQLAPQHWSIDKGNILKIALVQPNVPLSTKWVGINTLANIKQLHAMSKPLSRQVDLIIWPESAIAASFSKYQQPINQIVEDIKPASLLTGSLRKDPQKDKVYNSIFLLDGTNRQIYDKQTLVPFGEYIPMVKYFSFMLRLIGLPELGLSSGDLDKVLMHTNNFILAVNICYEIIFTKAVAKASQQSDVLVTISDDGWFGDTIGPAQHFQMARVRAKENGRYLIRASNDGISAVIDDTGKVVQTIERATQGTLIAEVVGKSGRTPYSYIADWIDIFLLLIAVSLCLFFSVLNRKKINNL